MSLSPGAREYLLALADDEHVVGARHTAWIGLGPFLEEDLAFCSIAQDELGHAIALYELLLADDGRSTGELDTFALLRNPGEYRSCELAELECSDWNDSLVRHWLYDRAEHLRWNALVDSSDERVAAIAHRSLREERFHLSHAEQFMSRIAVSRPPQLLASIERLIPIARRMWTPTVGEAAALAARIATASSEALAESWELAIRSDLARWGLEVDWDAEPIGDPGDRCVRSDGFDDLLRDLRKVIELDESAVW